jgi:hypothetical protein
MDLGHLGDFLGMMPCLESLEVNLCGGATQYLPLNELRSLVFTNANVSVASLRRLVSSCPKLERFEYRSPGGIRNIGDDGDEAEREFSWGQAQRILYKRRKTLKHLNFGFPNFFHRLFDWPILLEDVLGSFRDFSALETLFVRVTSLRNGEGEDVKAMFPASVEALVGVLPESLTVLGFCSLHAGWDGVDKLVQAIRRGHFPKLERVMLDQGKVEREVSRELLATVGVRCEN